MKITILTLLAAGLVGIALSAAYVIPAGSVLPPALCAAAMIVALLGVLGGNDQKL